MKSLLLVVAVVLLGLAACTKDTKQRPVLPFFAKIFSWEAGSYWIMQDSATGRIDSFYVMSREISSSSAAEDEWQAMETQIMQVNTADSNEWTRWHFRSPGNGIESHLRLTTSSEPDSLEYFPGFFYYPSAYQSISFSSNGRLYNNVYYNSTEIDFPQSTKKLSLAVSSEFGLIWMKVNFRSYMHTWHLIRNKINR